MVSASFKDLEPYPRWVGNVARRTGLGVVMLAARERLGRLPDYYFQAVGSAAGVLGSTKRVARLLVRRVARRLSPA
jgi:hypothetical protein